MKLPRAAVCVFLLLRAPHASFSQNLSPDVLRIAQVIQVNQALLKGLPLYTCLETMARSRPGSDGRKVGRRDIVQVDVAIGSGQEIYSWPGDPNFSSKDIFSLVGHGLLATGLFEAFPKNLFVSRNGAIKAAGEASLNGRDTYHFTYAVSSLESRWEVNWLGAIGTVDEVGQFWVDKSNLTLLRLAVTAQNIPPSLPVKAVDVVIDYQVLSINERRALLPSEAHVVVTDLSDATHRNDVVFSHCHLFAAESTLSSGPFDLEQAVSRYESQREILAPGLTFAITLETAIDSEAAKVGDPISARLERAVKTSDNVTVPAGSLLKGRIREFDRLDEPPNTLLVGLEFDELDWPGHMGSFLAEMISPQHTDQLNVQIPGGEMLSRGSLIGMLSNSVSQTLEATAVPGVAIFYFRGPHVTIPKGLHMVWRTRKREND